MDTAKLRHRLWSGNALFVGLAILMSGLYYINVHQQDQRAQCFSDYNTAFAQTSDTLRSFSNQRQDAVDMVILGIGDIILNPPDPKDKKAVAAAEKKYVGLFTTYATANADYKKAREENPLPKLPSC